MSQNQNSWYREQLVIGQCVGEQLGELLAEMDRQGHQMNGTPQPLAAQVPEGCAIRTTPYEPQVHTARNSRPCNGPHMSAPREKDLMRPRSEDESPFARQPEKSWKYRSKGTPRVRRQYLR